VSGVGERPLPSLVDWPAVFAGAVIAAGISATLLAFGSAIGLSVVSTAPTWRDTTPWFWLISGLFLLLTALASFGFGGYVAGRLRHRLGLSDATEMHFRDGIHGLVTWGLAIVFTAILAAVAATSIARSSTGSDVTQSIVGENLIASELDNLFRTDHRIDTQDLAYRRSEAARVLLKSSSHDGISGDDQDYLTAMIAGITSVSVVEAHDRVQRAIAQSKDAIHRARQASVLEAFMIAAALLLGAAAAWMSSVEGGLDRENGRVFVWNWGRRSHV
jgi:amino acid transporter